MSLRQNSRGSAVVVALTPPRGPRQSGVVFDSHRGVVTDEPTAVVKQDFSAVDDATIQKYLADNNITNARKQPSGLYYIPVITNPNGLQATANRRVSVLYTGTLLNGTVFDASSQHGNTPITFALGAGQVIAGWDEGIALMKKNEKSILLIPSGMAYGASSPSPTHITLRAMACR